MSDLFYVFGIALTAMALVLSFVGLRSERFPDSRTLYAGVLGLMAALVAGSCAFAIVLSREEAEHRSEEVAHFEAEQAEEAQDAEDEAAAAEPGEEAGAPAPEPQEPAGEEGAPAETLALSSPEDGALVFEPTELEGEAGDVSIEYTNPSPVPHNVAIEASGETLAESETVTGGDAATASAKLDAGDYVFYCAIPGHREAGMEGALTIR